MNESPTLEKLAKTPGVFWAASFVSAAPQLLAAIAFSQAPIATIALIVGWNVAPFVVPMILYVAGARHAAWGWLLPTAVWGAWVAGSVVTSDSSTAGLGFMWGPVWNFAVFGPIGAGIAVLAARKRRAEKSAP